MIENIIKFNSPYQSGNELNYISEAFENNKLSGNGIFTKKCQSFFEKKYNFKKCLLTTSCTDALEMTAILLKIGPGDEVIIPSYTFVSTALAFERQGATIVFADSESNTPNLDVTKVEKLITKKTKVIVPVHYAGVSCDMDSIMSLAKKYNLYVVEDAAQAIDSFYKGKPLGSIGHLSTFSFHDTKNIICGEGGMLVINDEKFINRAEIIWEKGTNRSLFFKGEVDKYGWVDLGSSFLPSEIIAAFLYAQLECLEDIQAKRKKIWKTYYDLLTSFQSESNFKLPVIPDYATNNGHMFYLVFNSIKDRDEMILKLKKNNILSVFHYLSLHKSEYFKDKYNGDELVESEKYTNCLLRLPMFYALKTNEIKKIVNTIIS